MIIAIDGPAGSGKGTIAKLLSERLNFINIDTGAMYRCVALKMLENNMNLDNYDEIHKILNANAQNMNTASDQLQAFDNTTYQEVK